MKRIATRLLCALLVWCVGGQPVWGALLTLANQPIYLGAAVPPMVMITMTKDQQLFKKAYNDYSDLDGDGALETTYKHAIDYYGYFDPYKCYDYSAANQRFEPAHATPNKYCSGKWSGNFLNWATMTRMDAVRKILYGGLRSTDTPTLTVLERAYLPTDAHAFAKHYAGADLAQLTPFTDILTSAPASTSTTATNVPDPASGGDRTFAIASGAPLSEYAVGDQVRIEANANNWMIGTVACINRSGTQTSALGLSCGTANTMLVHVPAASSARTTAANFTNWTIVNPTRVGLTICNATLGGTGPLGTGTIGSPQNKSQTNTNPPLMRVSRGNYALWSGNERWQCYWREESTSPGANLASYGGVRNNGNRAASSGLYASTFEPRKDAATNRDEARGLGEKDYVVRVRACVTGLLGTERCKEYNTAGAYKPIGLLQVYGDPNLIHFGLITGSYSKNISGGVLRKNVGTFTNEVAADGTFLAPAGGGIVRTLDRMRIYGYFYGNGTYLGSDGDNCAFQLTNITEGACRSWGNPMSEVYYETLRYFAGATSPTPAFHTTADGTLIAGLATAPWPSSSTQVLSNANYCAPLNVVVFNSSVSTNEDDNQIPASLASIGSSQTAQQLTQAVGSAEPGADAVSGTNQFFYGKTPSLASSDPGYELCSAKQAPAGWGLGDVVGICPEGPTLGGTYLLAGLAWHAKTNRIRSDLTAVPPSDARSLKVTTYGVNLSTNVPTLPIKVLGDAAPRAIIQPIYRLALTPTALGGGALVELKVISQTVTATSNRGAVYLNWEDSEQGGDYDQDMWGILSWCMQVGSDTTSCPQNNGVPNSISVTTRTVAESTANQQGFGYVVSGTNKDGPHFHSGIEGFSFTDPTGITVTPNTHVNATGGCNNCQVGQPATTAVYSLTGTGAARNLKDPLWYAAKYGGFRDTNGNGLPDVQSEWDAFLSDGTTGSDGIPDNYFLVSNPLGLENALNKVFLTILQTSSASSVAANSTSLQSGTRVYQARFNANDWSGQLLAIPVNLDGSLGTIPDWNAGELMNPLLNPGFNPGSRVLVTYNKGIAGHAPRSIPLRWPTNPSAPGINELTPAMVQALKTNPASGTVESDARGAARLQYLRGDGANEGLAVGQFRRRQTSKLGDIVNSNPVYVGAPSAGHGDAAYATFRLAYANRTPVLYVGANDGFLHGFNAETGEEMLGYMPSKAALKANKLTNPAYVHEYYVDGSPEVQDVCVAYGSGGVCAQWRTLLAIALGGGGQALSLLDITDPSQFSEANAQSIVKWEFTDADDPDLGYVYGQPLLRRMANGRWALVVSGGYNNSQPDGAASTTGYGYLFILFVDGPSGPLGTWVPGVDYIKLTTGTGSIGTPNGLAQPFAADIDSDGRVDFLYAGDLRGDFWKFDVRSSAPANWPLAQNRVRLFQARDPYNNPQPITAPADGTVHITGTGFMINFGTGKYLENTDVVPPGTGPYQTQTIYGIWDKNDATPISSQTTVTRADLLEQQVLADVSVGGRLGHVTSNLQPNYTAPPPAGHLGWFLDWANATPNETTADKNPPTGERAVFVPQVINNRLILTTLIPDISSCRFGGDSILMVLNNQTGSRFDTSPFDISGDQQFNTADLVTVTIGGVTQQIALSGVSSGIGITGSPAIIKFGAGGGAGGSSPGGYLGGYVGGSGSEAAIYTTWLAILSGSSAGTASLLLDLGANFVGRLSWREIMRD